MKIGYARVSTAEQNLDLQLDALRMAGCARIYEEHASGKNAARTELANCLKALRAGDVLVVWRLDRLGRNLPDLVRIVGELESGKVGSECRDAQDAKRDSQSPFRLRLSRQLISARAALRPCRFATPSLRSAQATQHSHKWLDGVSHALAYALRRSLSLPPTAIRPRLRLPETIGLRFALHGRQRWNQLQRKSKPFHPPANSSSTSSLRLLSSNATSSVNEPWPG
jgi:hypothetical protein